VPFTFDLTEVLFAAVTPAKDKRAFNVDFANKKKNARGCNVSASCKIPGRIIIIRT